LLVASCASPAVNIRKMKHCLGGNSHTAQHSWWKEILSLLFLWQFCFNMKFAGGTRRRMLR